MRLFGIMLLAFLTVEPAIGSPSESAVGQILKADSILKLSTTAAEAMNARRRVLGCKIQRREKVPPTLCYPNENLEKLDQECLQASRVASRIPVADEFTSAICREAIAKREKDLDYALSRDASR